MKYLVNGEQMKAIDQYSIKKLGIPSIVLMEKAAMACAKVILNTATKNDKILAVCGIGNNGGDGIATARILKEAGLDVSVLLVGEEKKASEQTRKQLQIGRNLDLPIFQYKNIVNEVSMKEYNIIIDAIFGIGLSKPILGDYKDVINQINSYPSMVVAVDIPSGVDASSGFIQNVAVRADVTVTFGYNKLGLLFYPGASFAGRVLVEDIGFPQKALLEVSPKTFMYERDDIEKRIPKRETYSNKGTFGKVLVIGGAKNMAGAACLCATGAYRMGAGLVKILTIEDNRVIMQTALPEALLSTYTKENFTKEWFCKELLWASTVIIGPGLSNDFIAEEMLDLVLDTSNVPCVLDADALNLIAQKNKHDKINHNPQIIITPHLKEMERLTSYNISDMKKDFVAFSVEAIKERDYTLVLKDARTLVVDKENIYVNICGNSGMAVGGSGDVLSGIIGGLLAQGMKPFDAAALGVYLHALAGDRAAQETNEYSMIARDILNGLIQGDYL
ncbi:MAG: NAD(P)H-hydrate dehydratase [Velocimicrobium sp.]